MKINIDPKEFKKMCIAQEVENYKVIRGMASMIPDAAGILKCQVDLMKRQMADEPELYKEHCPADILEILEKA